MRLLIKNIKGLAGVYDKSPEYLSGAQMNILPVLENAFLAIEDGKIAGFGLMSEWEGISDWNGLEIIDADGKYVLPAWCDSHTHLVFAGNREGEFVDRINGLSYGEIAAKGGGILNSAKKLAETSEDELFTSALHRLNEVKAMGTGAIEIKSGYGLSLESELKMLRVIKRLKENSPVTIKATLLAAHAVPAEFKDKKSEYVDFIIEKIMPAVADEELADFVDVFCETNYFTVEDTDRILTAGAQFGLVPKIHVNQFTAIGGVGMGVKHHALSVDHLEVMNPEDYEVLKHSKTMPTALPSCSFFLEIPYTPARAMINQGLPLALATDYNPGSTPSGNVPFVISLACIKMKMTPEEAINAATINSAYAMDVHETLGSIAIGKTANLIITQPMTSLAFMPYSFGSRLIETVILNGLVQKFEG
jgi:imidazolonepropionase